MVQKDELQKRMLQSSSLSPSHVSVEDISGGCGTSFAITVVSSAFDGVRLLERHRMIHNELGTDLGDIHALQLKCFTPAQFEATNPE